MRHVGLEQGRGQGQLKEPVTLSSPKSKELWAGQLREPTGRFLACKPHVSKRNVMAGRASQCAGVASRETRAGLGICGVAAGRGLEELSCRKDLPKEMRLQLTQASAEQEQQQSRSKVSIARKKRGAPATQEVVGEDAEVELKREEATLGRGLSRGRYR